MKWIAMAALALMAAAVRAQGLNVDLEGEFGPEVFGTGTPSASYGAASNQVGSWHPLYVAGWFTHNLIGLDGNLSSVTIQGTNGGSGGGTNFPQNTGDYRRLMSDAKSVDDFTFSMSHIQNGEYRLFLYCASIALPNVDLPAEVYVPQASIPRAACIGRMPSSGNMFAEGFTHTVHTVNITDGTLDIRVRAFLSEADINGFQLIPVPEPACIFSLSSFLVFLQINRRRNRDNTVPK